jgi:hypothetical protein
MNRPFKTYGSLVFAVMLGATTIAISPACAFNPQPDPPAKILKGIDGGDSNFNRNNANNKGAFGRVRNNLYEDPNLKHFYEDPNLKSGKSKGAIGSVMPGASPGLLEGNLGLSSRGPSATGTPNSIGAGSGGARFGGAGIR